MSDTRPADRYAADPAKGNISGKLIAVGAVIFAVIAIIVVFQYFQKINSATVTATQAGFERIADDRLRISVDVPTRSSPETGTTWRWWSRCR